MASFNTGTRKTSGLSCQQVLAKQFVPKGNFMVAPPEFATDPDFHGYRAGLTSVDGVWKFAYFVTDSH